MSESGSATPSSDAIPAAAAATTAAPDAPSAAAAPDPSTIDTKQLANELVKNLDSAVSTDPVTEPTVDPGPEIKFKLVYNKTNYEIVMGENRTVRELKEYIETLTKLPRAMQKLMFKG